MSKKFTAEEDIQALSQRNLQGLMKTLSNKETQQAIKDLSRIEKDEWKAMASTVETLNSFVSLGGSSELITILTGSVERTIKLQIDSLLAPLENEINQAITDIITPFMNDILTPLINDLNTFLSENKTGSGVGGIIGGVLGAFTPLGPVVGGIVGAVVGGVAQVLWELLPETLTVGEYSFMSFATWIEQTGSTNIYEYFEYLKGVAVAGPGVYVESPRGIPKENY